MGGPHCCTGNLLALIVCAQIPSINGVVSIVQSVNRQQQAWQVLMKQKYGEIDCQMTLELQLKFISRTLL